MSILSMSITGGVMIVAVVLIRALLLERLPKKTFLVLWGLVMLRLLVPFQVSSKISIYNLVPNNNQVLSPMMPAVNTPIPVVDISPIINSTTSSISPITVVWISGILLTLLCTAFVYVRSMRNMRTSLPCENTFVENWLQSIPLKRKIQVRVFDRIKTPLTYGIIHPVILLPKNMDFSNEEQLLTILTHEYIHIKRFDNIKKLMMVLTLSIHWFNPLVWVMLVLCNRDIELACDEQVLLDLGKDERATYALTLVELSEQGNAFSLSSGFSKNALEERIKAIMKHKKMTAFTVAIVLVLIIGITTVFATNAKEEEETIVVDAEETMVVNAPLDYSIYKEFGLIYNEDKDALYYQGELVRYFEDYYPLGDGGFAGIDFLNKNGTVDIYGVRDLTNLTQNSDGSFDPSGQLMAIEPYTQVEFNARNISELINPPRAIAYAGEPMSEAEAIASFAEYKPYGLEYDAKTERLYFDGKLVRNFLDVMSSNGESLEGGSFSGTMRRLPNDDGEVDVYTVRDFSVVDKEGNGKLLDVKAHADEELTGNSLSFLWPTVETEITAGFNEYPNHTGVDIKGAIGTEVYASASGTVIIATTGYTGYGNYIIIDHGGGYTTLYAHCNELHVVEGESVSAGQIIATIGSTGNTTDNCLHFEIREGGTSVDPMGLLYSSIS